jgi:hypothetical protein
MEPASSRHCPRSRASSIAHVCSVLKSGSVTSVCAIAGAATSPGAGRTSIVVGRSIERASGAASGGNGNTHAPLAGGRCTRALRPVRAELAARIIAPFLEPAVTLDAVVRVELRRALNAMLRDGAAGSTLGMCHRDRLAQPSLRDPGENAMAPLEEGAPWAARIH